MREEREEKQSRGEQIKAEEKSGAGKNRKD